MPGSAAGIMKVSERIRCASADAGTSQMTNRQVTTTKRRTGFPLRRTVIEFLAPAMVICRRTHAAHQGGCRPPLLGREHAIIGLRMHYSSYSEACHPFLRHLGQAACIIFPKELRL